jgi:hypothetical protein
MKIAIVTQPLLGNYGGILQNYALQYVLKRMNHSVVTIDYTLTNSLWRYFRHTLKYMVRKAWGKLQQDETAPARYRLRTKKMERFVQNHITLTPRVSRYSADILVAEQVDVIVVGSDQVWRPRYNRYLEDMFLRFAEGMDLKRVAYAASFGVGRWEFSSSQTRTCRRLAALFNAISVREESGVTLCMENLGVEATAVLDPTLLLHAEDYAKLCADVPKEKEPFLAAYFLHSHHKKAVSAKYEFVKELAKQKGLALRIFEADNVQSAPIEEWLSVFRDASMIVTESFHGTVFSIINHREFLTLENKSRGTARLKTLLGALGLEDRLVSEPSSLSMSSLPPIAYDEVELRLDNLRLKSMTFLQDALTK